MERVRCNSAEPTSRASGTASTISTSLGCRGCGLVYAGPRRLTPEESRARYSADFFEKEYLPGKMRLR